MLPLPSHLPRFSRDRIASAATRQALAWRVCLAMLVAQAWLAVGCGTTNQRTGTEQMLMSDAVDMSISRMDFRPLAGRKAFLDTAFIRPGPVPGVPNQLVNADYVISGLRQALFAAHCELVDTKEEAEIIIEPRLGTLATNGHEVVYGIPQTNALAQASATLSGAPILPPLPELSFGRSHSHFGLAKLAVFAYDRQTRDPVWQSGIEKAESTAKNTWIVGAGPFQRGTIYEGYRFAGTQLKKKNHNGPSIETVPFAAEHVFESRGSEVRLAEEEVIPSTGSGGSNPAHQQR